VNPATALAQVLVDELVRCGVTEAVLAPGSRSAPLAFALHAADAAGRLRLHVRVDERSAGFLALGLAKASGVPAAVVTTSGTAVANLHPAVLEAAHADVPMLVLTADRPPELRGVGANQTVDQIGLFGTAVRQFVEVGTPERRAGQNAYWRSVAVRAVHVATTARGPVHLNLALREPLIPDGPDDWPEPLTGRPGGLPWTQVLPVGPPPAPADDLPARTAVVLGDTDPATAAAAVGLAEARGWPVVAEPSSGAAPGPCVLPGGDLVLGVPGFLDAHRPDRVLLVGRTTLSRAVDRLLAAAPLDAVTPAAIWPDPGRQVARVLAAVPAPGPGAPDPGWLLQWQAAAADAAAAVDKVLAAATGLTEPAVAAAVLDAAPPGTVVVAGSSKPVRDLFLAGPRWGVRVLANRGAAGIDGTVSTAVGAALAAGRPTYALLGDLTFLHDANGLIIGPGEPRPDLTVVVVNNDGGAIFGLLEQGGPEHAAAFERVFGTPHGVDLAALAAATGTPYTRVATADELAAALADPDGIRLVEVRTDRAEAVDLDKALRSATHPG
jgi:2-succinyl-5-enolpyruvyl-6-hydroxy-3-cyclohexene-1-carboxylate synthase